MPTTTKQSSQSGESLRIDKKCHKATVCLITSYYDLAVLLLSFPVGTIIYKAQNKWLVFLFSHLWDSQENLCQQREDIKTADSSRTYLWLGIQTHQRLAVSLGDRIKDHETVVNMRRDISRATPSLKLTTTEKLIRLVLFSWNPILAYAQLCFPLSSFCNTHYSYKSCSWGRFVSF